MMNPYVLVLAIFLVYKIMFYCGVWVMSPDNSALKKLSFRVALDFGVVFVLLGISQWSPLISK